MEDLDPEYILNISSGKELDELVAKYVMDGVKRNYSSSISDAWLIADKLVSLGWRVDVLYSLKEVKVNAIKMVGSKPYSLYAKFGSIYASSVPEGLCKLGLLAMIIETRGW